MSTPHLPAVSPFILADVSIRPAITADMPAKQAIKAHYILHTLTEVEQVLPPSATRSRRFTITTQTGWVQLSPYRSPRNHTCPLARTTELSVFVHPDHLHRGVGSLLVQKVFDLVAHPERYDASWMSPAFRGDARIRSVVALLAFASAERDKGDPRVGFYRKWGMEVAGRLEAVAWKKDQWVDLTEMQRQFP